MYQLSNQVIRKFEDVIDLDEWNIKTDSGWEPLDDIKQTIEYEVYTLTLINGLILKCADDHIVFDENMNEIFVKDLTTAHKVQTINGPQPVVSVIASGQCEKMFDVGVDSLDHRFYSNDILSHNTTTAVGYLLWYAMFVDNSTILIAAHKYTGAQEIMLRLRYAYELCPDHIRCGVTSYNKQSIEFDNGSRIVAQTTTETTGRGMSVSLLYCLNGETTVKIRNKKTLIEEEITLRNLYQRLYNPNQIIE
jgi:hypothetical protein